MAIYANLYIDQGTSFSSSVIVEGSLGIVDLTGYIARAQIRKSYQSNIFWDFNCEILEPYEDGEILLTLSPAISESMRAGRYVYDLEIENTTTGEIYRVVEGQVEINPSVTR